MPVVCVLYDVAKNSKFPVWNDFQFCLTARQTVKKALSHSSLSMHDQAKFRAKVLLNYSFVFRFMFKIQNSFEIKSFLDHKLTFVDRDKVNRLLNPALCFACAGVKMQPKVADLLG